MKENIQKLQEFLTVPKSSKLYLLISIIVLSSFSSCSKTINGKVYDNFRKPIEGVSISIVGSDYKSITDNCGQFALDYAPGNLVVKFEKEGYRNTIQEISISEKQDYPLEEKTLIKLPIEKGIYLFTKELNDYIPLSMQNTPKMEEKTKGVTKFYQRNQDSTTVIQLSSIEEVAILHYNKQPSYLGKVGTDGLIGLFRESMLMLPGSVAVNDRVKVQTEKVSKLITIHRFAPEYGVDYVYLFDTEKHYLASDSEPYYTFRFENK